MRARKHSLSTGPGVNITPLSDIMLSLLIFFMLVSRAGVDNGADAAIDLPTVTAASEEELTQEGLANTVVLNVYGNPGSDITEVVTLPPLKEQALSLRVGGGLDEVTPYLRTLAANNPELSVIIRGDRGTQYQFLEPVLTAAAEARVAVIKWAVTKEDE